MFSSFICEFYIPVHIDTYNHKSNIGEVFPQYTIFKLCYEDKVSTHEEHCIKYQCLEVRESIMYYKTVKDLAWPENGIYLYENGKK